MATSKWRLKRVGASTQPCQTLLVMVKPSDVCPYALTAAVGSSCKARMIANSFGGKLYECWSMVHRVLRFTESHA